jgi:hypothetical protein
MDQLKPSLLNAGRCWPRLVRDGPSLLKTISIHQYFIIFHPEHSKMFTTKILPTTFHIPFHINTDPTTRHHQNCHERCEAHRKALPQWPCPFSGTSAAHTHSQPNSYLWHHWSSLACERHRHESDERERERLS